MGSSAGLTVRAPGLTLLRRRRPLHNAMPEGLAADGSVAAWYYELSAGGLSNHWTCAVPRFSPEDFTEGGEVHEKYRWPIGYDDLRPFYAEMERVLHVGGSGEDVLRLPGGEVSHRVKLAPDWQTLAELARARGHGITSLPLAYGAAWTVTRSGTPFNSFVRMLQDIPLSPRIRVLFGARALRLEWSREQRRVTRVIYADKSGGEHAIEADAFVVAAGALSSAKLLLESRSSDFPEGLGNTHGVLGRYLHDHPLAKIALELHKPLSIHPPVFITRGPYQPGARLQGVATVLWSGTLIRLRRIAALSPGKATQIGFNLFGTLLPREENGVSLTREPQGAGLDIRIRFDDVAHKTLASGRRMLLDVLDAGGYAPKEKLWLVEQPGASVHYGGTVRMHASPKFGMLNGLNRLHAVGNVLVVDSGAFTTGPEKNPTLTAMAISARASHLLAEELRSSGRVAPAASATSV